MEKIIPSFYKVVMVLSCILCLMLFIQSDNANAQRFVDNNDGTVTDTERNLIWTKNPQPFPPPGNYDWRTAITLCNQFVFADISSWRLPLAGELSSLHEGTTAHEHPFDSIPRAWFWSRTGDSAVDPTKAWAINVQYGLATFLSKESQLAVWPVADGPSVLGMGRLRLGIDPEAARNAGAQWRIVGTDEWLDSGQTAQAPLGVQYVEFKDVDGWRKPANLQVEVQDGEIAAAHALYTVPQGLRVMIEPEDARSLGAQWRRIGTQAWLDSGQMVQLPSGSHGVEFKQLYGWHAPPPIQVDVQVDQMATITGMYHPAPIEKPWETEIGIVNPTPLPMTGSLHSLGAEGDVLSTFQNLSLPGYGRLNFGVTGHFGPEIGPLIKAMRLDITSGMAVGYQKFSRAEKYRAGVEALPEVNHDVLHIPLIQSNSMFWTGIGLHNAEPANKYPEFTFSDLSRTRRQLPSYAHDAFLIEDVKGSGVFEGAGTISHSSGIAGLLVIGSDQQLHGTSLSGSTATEMVFPHLAQNDQWWTKYLIYNPGNVAVTLDLVAYDHVGGVVFSQNGFARISGRKLFSSETSLPAETAWWKVRSSAPVIGHMFFGLTSGTEMAGFSVTDIASQSGVFPNLEPDGWTGIAFVNSNEQMNHVRLQARNNSGEVVASRQITMSPLEKWVGIAHDLFPDQNISFARYVSFEADAPITGFQLNGSADGTMLDAIPALGAAHHVGTSQLYFPHIAVE